MPSAGVVLHKLLFLREIAGFFRHAQTHTNTRTTAHRFLFAQMWNEVVCTIKGRKVFVADDGEEDEEA